MDFNRIRKILWDLKLEHGTWIAIEKLCGVRSGSLARIAKGQVEPSVNTLQKLHAAFPDVFPKIMLQYPNQPKAIEEAMKKPIDLKKLVGKTAHYRLPHEMQAKESDVVSYRVLTNLAGNEVTLLKMKNGDEEDANACYFDFSFDASLSSR